MPSICGRGASSVCLGGQWVVHLLLLAAMWRRTASQLQKPPAAGGARHEANACPIGTHWRSPEDTTLPATCEQCPVGQFDHDAEAFAQSPQRRRGGPHTACVSCPLGRCVPGFRNHNITSVAAEHAKPLAAQRLRSACADPRVYLSLRSPTQFAVSEGGRLSSAGSCLSRAKPSALAAVPVAPPQGALWGNL